MDVVTQLREVVVRVAGLPTDFPAMADLYLDLGVASVTAMQLLLEIEEHFGVSVPDDRFVVATSLDSLSELVASLTAHDGGSGER